MHFFRSIHGAPTDPKWLVVARKAKVLPVHVAAVWWSLLDHASQNESRGSIEGYDPESIAAFFGMETEEVQAVIVALYDKELLKDGRVVKWEKHNSSWMDNPGEGRLPWEDWDLLRQQVFKRDGRVCRYCGSSKKLTVDHVIPVTRGGGNELDNLVAACRFCNLSKGAKTPDEWNRK